MGSVAANIMAQMWIQLHVFSVFTSLVLQTQELVKLSLELTEVKSWSEGQSVQELDGTQRLL